MRIRKFVNSFVIAGLLLAFSFSALAQEPKATPPPPSKPRSVAIPEVHEAELINGLKIVIVSRHDLPLVTASLLIRSGAGLESSEYAGLASVTADMITKGTELRNATEFAQEMEFLGASVSTGADWQSSYMNVSVMSDKLSKALSLMADAITAPKFPASELNLLKSQRIDSLKVRLKRPGVLWGFAAAQFTYGAHSDSGTPESISRIRTRDVESFHTAHYRPNNAVLIFAGDISKEDGIRYGRLFFGGWKSPSAAEKAGNRVELTGKMSPKESRKGVVKRILVIDLPDSGQAAVGYAKELGEGRVSCDGSDKDCKLSQVYYPATVLNSILGGGYSARLNQEIRIKRGLSYGARSGFDWGDDSADFNAFTQTKNESAGEVAELIDGEIGKLAKDDVTKKELGPRKAVVIGSFGRSLQTDNGLAARIRDLYVFGLKPAVLDSFVGNVEKVTDKQVQRFASRNLLGGDMIIVGDAKMFLDDLAKRFPNLKVEVIKASDLDLNRPDLKKPQSK